MNEPISKICSNLECQQPFVIYDGSPFETCPKCRRPAPERKKTMKIKTTKRLEDKKTNNNNPWQDNAIKELEG